MSQSKKSAALRSKNDSRRARDGKRVESTGEAARRAAVRRVLAGRKVDPDTARIIEETAVTYARASCRPLGDTTYF
jgi:hypothetical protein